MTQLARLVFIAFTLLRFGIDDIALSGMRQRWVRALARVAMIGRRFDEPRGVRLRRALERLGPIFVKFGQVLSTRRDLLPLDVADELAKLQDRVPPFPSAESIAIVERAFGQRIDQVFASFEADPVASASIAQVHFAPCTAAGRWRSRCCARACCRRSRVTWPCCTAWRPGSSGSASTASA